MSAVEAKRRALHAAEHSANIERVMANRGAERSTLELLLPFRRRTRCPENFPARIARTSDRRAALFRPDNCGSQTVARTSAAMA